MAAQVTNSNGDKCLTFELASRELKRRISGLLSDGVQNDHAGDCVVRISTRVIVSDPFSWLKSQSFKQKMYWKGREETHAIAAVGVADRFVSNGVPDFGAIDSFLEKRLLASPSNVRYFGGMRFDPTV